MGGGSSSSTLIPRMLLSSSYLGHIQHNPKEANRRSFFINRECFRAQAHQAKFENIKKLSFVYDEEHVESVKSIPIPKAPHGTSWGIS